MKTGDRPASLIALPQLPQRIGLMAALFLILFSGNLPLWAQDAPDPPAAVRLAQTATNAQNAGDFTVAAGQWEKLLKEYPQSSYAADAWLNAGVCYQSLNRFGPAIEKLDGALERLPADRKTARSNALLLLGFCQKSFGEDLAAVAGEGAGDAESQTWLKRSTETFDRLFKEFPEFVDADQAWYFQGQAFEMLGDLESAAGAFAKTQESPQATFRYDGLYALANVREKQGQYETALKHYREFLALADEAGGHELQGEVEYRTAATLLQRGSELLQEQDPDAARPLIDEAVTRFEKLAAQPDSELAEDALFQQAIAEDLRGDEAQAAALFARLAETDSPLNSRAAVYAGRHYLDAGQLDNARTWLDRGLQAEPRYAAEAAHWRVQLHLRENEPGPAFELADQWVKQLAEADQAALLPALLLDRADAAFADPNRKPDSPKMYLEVVDQFPDHPLAPTALYYAAFAELDLGQHAAAIQQVDRFQTAYPDDPFLPDALEIRADAWLLSGEFVKAETAFRDLAARTDSDKSQRWALRAALAAFQQEKYQAVIDALTPRLESMSPGEQAEAHHWIGSSAYQLEDDAAAIAELNRVLELDPAFRRGDETLLTCLRSQLRAGQATEAMQSLNRLRESRPDSPLVAEAMFRIGEAAYQAGDYVPAAKQFSELISAWPDSTYVPFSLYNAAWSHVKLGTALNDDAAAEAREQYGLAERKFSQLIEQHPDHELAASALIGRGASRRKLGQTDAAIEDLKAFLATGPDAATRVDALYELGLAQIGQEDWEGARQTFQSLIEEAPDSPLADRFHYELAWAHYSLEDPAAALREFSWIARERPSSPLAAEAQFHVGNAAYDDGEFAAAIAAYDRCVAAPEVQADLREKAMHKRAWAWFKQDNFEQAEAAFQEQIEAFPGGELVADAKVMVSESLLQMKKYPEAFEAYRVARPVISELKNEDPRFGWVTLLHGAQSANKSKNFEAALEFVEPLLADEQVPLSLKQDAQLEVGYAWQGLDDVQKSRAAWQIAAENPGKTGARAQCMLGDWLMQQKQLDEAIQQFKLVIYGFGGVESDSSIRPWQAYAAYEAARCYFVQVESAESRPEEKRLVEESIRLFEYLVENYPEDRLVDQARQQLELLNRLKQKLGGTPQRP